MSDTHFNESMDLENPPSPPSLPPPPRARHPFLYAYGVTTSGCVGIALASLGLAWWSVAEFIIDPSSWSPDTAGYSILAFMGMVLFTVFASVGVSALYIGASTLMRLWDNVLGLVAFGVVGVAFVVLGSLGMIWGSETMR